MTAAARALLRIREEMAVRNITQDDLAAALNCSQGRIAKILKGGTNLRVNDLDAIAQRCGIALSEAVRDRGLEFYAEMTPTELRLLEMMRQRPGLLQGVMMILRLQGAVREAPKGTPHRRVGRPLNSEKRIHNT